MGGGVVTRVEISLLGAPRVRRDGAEVVLPGSRKVRAMLGFLALAPLPVGRGQLCELLWEVPDDPRGELRWCLSKLRSIVDDVEHARVETQDDAVALDLGDCDVDALSI